jgi:hypothetical protein
MEVEALTSLAVQGYRFPSCDTFEAAEVYGQSRASVQKYIRDAISSLVDTSY